MVELQIDAGVKAAIANALTHAAKTPLDFVTYVKRSKLKHPIRARQLPIRPAVMVPFGYRVEYEIAEYRPGRPCRHLTVFGPGKIPEPAAVARIIAEFGYTRPLRQVLTWLEPIDAGRQCVHVVEPVD